MARRAAPHRGIDTPQADPALDAGGRPSKTAAKQHAQALQALGAELAALPADRIAAIDMPDALRAAIAEFRRTASHEGRRRQMQLVGKLMRGADDAALREAVAEATVGSARQTLALHEAERWRAELIADDAALARWLAQHPAGDAQQLRNLVRAARRDAAGLPPEARQPRSFRALFAYLRPRLDPP